MAIDEGARHRLHSKLEEVIGSEEAATLMTQLLPLGREDLATKQDLREVANQLREDVERLARRLIMWTSSMIIAAVGFAFAVGRLG